jgi:hypothetical protein
MRVTPLLFVLVASTGCNLAEGTVRARAVVDLDCEDSQLEVEEVSGSTYMATGCGRSAQYTCANYRTCVYDDPRPLEALTQSTESAKARQEPVRTNPKPATLREPPDGAGGFKFGMSEDDVRSACESSNHAYASAAPEHASCDGVASDVGAPATAGLIFCDGKLCNITLEIESTGQETLLQGLLRWKGALVERYGGPTSSGGEVPLECQGDESACLVDRRAKVVVLWSWPSRRSITLVPNVEQPDQAHVRIVYSATSRRAAPGL